MAHTFIYIFLQQLYQTLSDFDIRFYMYEILKVRNVFWYTQFVTHFSGLRRLFNTCQKPLYQALVTQVQHSVYTLNIYVFLFLPDRLWITATVWG